MVNLNLECGRTVYVSAFHCSPTYAGLLLGEPDERFNKLLIDDAIEDVSRMWGERKTYIISPILINEHTKNPELPPLIWHVWLTCNKPINE